MLGSVSSGLKVSAMNAPWMNTAGSPLPATSYSSSAPSVLALSNVASLSAPRRHRESAAEACSLRPHSTRGYAFGRPGLRESSLRLWPYSPECVEGDFCELRDDGGLRSSRWFYPDGIILAVGRVKLLRTWWVGRR